jgi:RsbRD-like negative regulator of sigma factor
MTLEGADPLLDALRARKGAIVRAWLGRTLGTYPDQSSRFLDREKDPFRNPVGHTLKEGLAALFDELLGGMDSEKVTTLLDGIVRIRAVQDFTAAQAVAFPFHLKNVIRESLHSAPRPPLSLSRGEEKGEEGSRPDALTSLEDRIDQMTLLAFDLFMRCRESIYEVRANETRRRLYLLERMHESNLPRTAEGRRASSRP